MILFIVLFFTTGFHSRSHAFDGKQLYFDNCGGSCHGIAGEGGKGPALNKQGLLAIATEEYFIKTMIHGRPTSGCPSFKKRLKDDEMRAISVFIKSWQTVDPVIVSQHTVIPGETEKGKKVFPVCVGCHDVGGVGAMGPSFIDPGFQASASDAFLRGTIMYGRKGTPMRGYLVGQGNVPELTPEEIDEVISYIRYIGRKRP